MPRRTLLWVPVLLALPGCASLPLTAATAPLAIAGWGAIVGSVFEEWAQPLPPLVLHAEAGPMLSGTRLDSGVVDTEAEPVASGTAWLQAWGIARADVDAGRVQMVRIGHHEGAAPGTRRAIVLPVRLGPPATVLGSASPSASGSASTSAAATGSTPEPVPQGTVVELRVETGSPVRLHAVHAGHAAATDCRHVAPPARAARVETLRGRSFGHERLTDTLFCPTLQNAGWQRSASLWYWVPDWDGAAARPKPAARDAAAAGPAASASAPAFPADRAIVMVYRNASNETADARIAVRVDGREVVRLRNARCSVLLLTPGEHVLAVGRGAPGVWSVEPLRELALRLGPGDRAYVEHLTNDHEANNLLRSVRDAPAFWEATIRFVERPALTAIDGCAGSTPVVTP